MAERHTSNRSADASRKPASASRSRRSAPAAQEPDETQVLPLGDDAEPVSDVPWTEHKYSFHAIVAAGIVGFLVGRLCSR